MTKLMEKGKALLVALDRVTTKHRFVLGALLAVLLSGALALYNVSSGPLHNLNDIGGWDNRALFIAMTACVQALVLLACTALSRVNFARTALRQAILTAGLFILLLAINQKAYVYVNVLQPVIRAMDEGGLAAGAAMNPNLSAPMLALVYLITRGRVYDMYLVKLFAIGCMLALAVLAMRAADRRGFGIRAEVLLALCVILPQGFLNAACSALPETAAVTLLAAALTLLDEQPKSIAGALCYGAACALSGAALYALPVVYWLMKRGGGAKKQLPLAALVAIAACVPAMIGGMPITTALGSLVSANFGLPMYASGAPTMYNLIPRALLEEMPQYAPTLRHMAALDAVTNAQEHYTQGHFEIVMRGMALVGLAVYMGLCALALRDEKKTPLHRAMILALGALITCPNATVAVWLLLDVLCLYAILAEPRLRLPACLVLFATMCTSAYPMTEETLLPMVYAFGLCLAALCMLLDVIPMGKEENHA